MGWSAAAAAMWGKTDREDGSWLPLVQHLEDTRRVAGHLWDTWLPRMVKDRIVTAVGDPSSARSVVTWLAAIHDVGKATPAFASQVYDLGTLDHVLEPAKDAGLACPHLARSQRRDFHHTVTGEVILEKWLATAHGFPLRRASHLGGVVGGHHGLPLSKGARNRGLDEFGMRTSPAFGDDPWRRVQLEILELMTQRTRVGSALSIVKTEGLPLTVQMDLTAVVIVSDWLASDSSRFPYDLSVPDEERWERGRDSLDLAGPWSPPDWPGDAESLLWARFPHLKERDLHPVQEASLRIASDVDSPPLMIIEAPMGHGKTESALLAAERLAQRFGAGGVYVGLPTMATSDAMFERVLGWLTHGSPGSEPSVYLAHSKAGLNDTYQGLLSESLRSRGVYDEDLSSAQGANPVVDLWTTGRKKGVLASMVVGTIDQALFAGLQTKHLALRHLALTGKVVVIDEVHAADDYMRSYLCRVLEWLGSYGTPVILMSATLPSGQRGQLVRAYQHGRGQGTATVTDEGGYPRITVVTDTVKTEVVDVAGSPRQVAVELIDGGPAAIAGMVAAEVGEGGCAAVICNTVGRAQETYEAMIGHLPQEEVVLVHSRFIGPHRMALERRLREELGPPGPGQQRPKRLVVVGTQVLEQSLDIDVDLMVTDIAPVDLILQRSGRLHRHDRPAEARPSGLRDARLLVAGVEGGSPADDGPAPDFEAGAVAVYGRHRLLRTVEALLPALRHGVTIPSDIPRLVELAYDPARESPATWSDAWTTSAAKDEAKRAKALVKAEDFQLAPVAYQNTLVGLLRSAIPAESDDLERTGQAQVRDTEDSLEVILAIRGDDQLVRAMEGADCGGQVVPAVIEDRDGRLARSLASCTVRLPRTLTHPGVIDAVITELESEPAVVSWQSNRYLAGQLVLLLDPTGVGTVCDHRVVYDRVRGLTVERPVEEKML